MTVAITGATGRLGRLVLDKLKAKLPAGQIVALVRSPAKAVDLGVAVREADYGRPDTLRTALAGVETLLLISSSEVGQRIAQHRNVIEAAKAAGVQWVLYTSVLHADTSAVKLAEEHRATEADLKASGLAFTILRHSWYTENYTALIPGAVAAGTFTGSAGDGKLSTATRADYAEAAVAAITGTGHKGATYELAGDVAYTLSELAAEVSRQTGTSVPYTRTPNGWDAMAKDGEFFDDSHDLSTLIGRPTTPLAQAVAEALNRQA